MYAENSVQKRFGSFISLFGLFAVLNRSVRRRYPHRRMGQGGGERGGLQPLSKFGQLRFFGQQEKFGQSQFLKKFACVCVFFFF